MRAECGSSEWLITEAVKPHWEPVVYLSAVIGSKFKLADLAITYLSEYEISATDITLNLDDKFDCNMRTERPVDRKINRWNYVHLKCLSGPTQV